MKALLPDKSLARSLSAGPVLPGSMQLRSHSSRGVQTQCALQRQVGHDLMLCTHHDTAVVQTPSYLMGTAWGRNNAHVHDVQLRCC